MIERSTVTTVSSKTGRKLDKLEGHIQFKEVTFSYPSRPDVAIFDKLSLDIPAGKIVALVGGSGSGKSTVISLIERFYEPLSGKILLDGNDIRELDLKWLRKQIGLVNQEPALFATTIRENILYGKDDATLGEIQHAAKLSEALSFINNLPDRFETQVLRFGCVHNGFYFLLFIINIISRKGGEKMEIIFQFFKLSFLFKETSGFCRWARGEYNYRVGRSRGSQYLVP